MKFPSFKKVSRQVAERKAQERELTFPLPYVEGFALVRSGYRARVICR